MQNAQIDKAIPWNPWHGCHKCSPGCQNCFVFKMDKRYGRDTTIVTKGKTTYELKDKDCPKGSLVKLCFSSDFFLEEADQWRDGIWATIFRRSDCIFVLTTKRPERIKQCFPGIFPTADKSRRTRTKTSDASKNRKNKSASALLALRIYKSYGFKQ